ncbi:hypothetical protein MMYC01_209345 [Madurella mycetomatis]|uniref:Uncharacterized protein n=1 Tax=Madurella mycetomatis TaxID=100816 RepID=A0A175VS26_9PEZI|nr:hypothetical protein MMYC01_209345 [Madurella mycetomatis]
MSRKIKYERVYVRNSSEDDEHDEITSDNSATPVPRRGGVPGNTYSTRCSLLMLLLVAADIALVSGTACFAWGRRVERHSIELDWFSPPGRIDHVFKYRWQFSARPSNNESQIWWDKVFPPAQQAGGSSNTLRFLLYPMDLPCSINFTALTLSATVTGRPGME